MMKKYLAVAYTTNGNGVKVSTTVEAESSADAELAAGRKFMEAGFTGKSIKIDHIEER